MKTLSILTALFVTVLLATNIQWKSDLKFSHKFHQQEVEAECTECHAGVDTSRLGSDDLLPAMETCYNCHDEEETECTVCHENPDEPVILPRITDYSPKFSHKLHLEKGTDCSVCHTGVEQADKVGAGLHLPAMATCMNCHSVPENKEGCYQCHESKDNLLPGDHVADWKHNHGMIAETDQISCRCCHTENYCTDCHQGENLDNRAHPAEFIITHSLSYTVRESDCGNCHQSKQFCVDCHLNVNSVQPEDHQLPDWAAEGHGQAAREDYDRCTVCHPAGDAICNPCHN